MGINTLLTINFEEEVLDDKKNAFHATLKKDGWVKASGIKNCWKTIFKDGVTESSALNVIKHDVERASKKSEILKYKAVVQLGEDILESFDNY
jgi:hypothetical protein